MEAITVLQTKQLHRNTQRLVQGLVVLLLVSLWCFVGFWSFQERGNTLAASELELQQLTSAVQEHTKGLFKQAETSLIVANHWIAAHPNVDPAIEPEFVDLVEQLRITSDGLLDIRMVTRSGTLRYIPDRGQAKQTNVTDRDYFKSQIAPQTSGYFVGDPVLSRVTNKWGIPISIPVKKGGAETAVLFVAIELDRIAASFDSARPKPNGTIVMFRDDGKILFRSPMDGSVIGTSVSKSESWKQHLGASPKGTYVSPHSPIDGASRIVSYSKVPGYPLVVATTANTDDTLVTWKLHTVGLSIAAAVVSLFCLLLGKVLIDAMNSESATRLALEKNNQRLAEAEAEQRGLLEKLHTAVIVHGTDTQITFSNVRACELLGLTEDQMRGKAAIDPAWCFVDTAGRRLAPQEYPVAQVISTLRPIVGMVVGVKTPEKEDLTWLLVSAFPELGATGKLQQVVVNFYDITRMREADERWRFAMEGSGDGVWDLNLQTGETEYSKRYQEMLGYVEGEVSNSHAAWIEHIHPDDQDRMKALIAQVLTNSEASYNAEYRLLCKDGSYKWIYARGMVVSRGADGKPLRLVGTHTDISDLKNAEAKVWHQANFDTLTQLPNRRLFYDRLDVQLKQAKRDNQMLALLFVDLDRFKDVNDTLGHDVGDQLLVEAARRIKIAVRESDTVARLGGDEFTVTLTEQHESSDIAAVAQKIIDLLSQPFNLGDVETFLSASVGIAMYPGDALTVNELVKNADQAMYAAKAAGRKGFQFFTQTMQDLAIDRMSLAGDLRRALAAEQFEVHYQPIVAFGNAAVSKAEALIRWRHPKRGLVSPAEFIPIAEEIGAIHEIGDWVFSQAAKQVEKWQSLYGSEFQISVNKSPVQFSGDQPGRGQWLEQLHTMGLAGKSIVVEITEGVLMNSNEKVTTSLMEFRDAGIQVAIDDFGTGYSSLSYLKKFDIDYLKIDQSFVQNLTSVSADLALCEAIIVMAHKLGLKVIAEGVETDLQRDLLRGVGCDFWQGYLFSRPLPAQAFEELLAQPTVAA